MKKLVVITNKFPYFNTEAFLESEIKYLQESFREVVFMPIIKGNVRKSCENAIISDSYNKIYRNKFGNLIKTLVSYHFYSQFFKYRGKISDKSFLVKLIHQDIHYRILKNIIRKDSRLFDSDTVVYSYWFTPIVYALLKIKEELGLEYKVVCRAHRFDVYDETGEMPDRTYCIENIDQIYPISQDAIDTFTEKYGHPEKYTLARLGVKDYNIINNPSRHGLFHVLTVSQSSARKRVLTIFDSLQEFAKRNTEIKVLWTHFGDGPLDQKLSESAINNTISNFTIELKGRVPNADIIQYYKEQSIDVFVNLSESEGVPVSVMEALSFGVPVIATNVGGTSEVMNTYNGVLLPSNPSRDEIIDANTFVYSSNLDRCIIKNNWDKISNSAKVFPDFVKKLKEL